MRKRSVAQRSWLTTLPSARVRRASLIAGASLTPAPTELRPASAASAKLKRFQTVASGNKGAFAEFKKEEQKGHAQTKYAADEVCEEAPSE